MLLRILPTFGKIYRARISKVSEKEAQRLKKDFLLKLKKVN